MGLTFSLWGRARGRLLLVVACGVAAGATNSALFALMNASLGKGAAEPSHIALFCILAVLVVATNTIPLALLSPMTRNMTKELAVDLARAVIATPLRRLEEIGRARVLTGFEQDLTDIMLAARLVPVAVTNVTIILGCLAYLFWLSSTAFFMTAPILVVGAAINAWTVAAAQRRVMRWRVSLDDVNRAQNDILSGIKELKLNAGRKAAFLDGVLEPARQKHAEEGVRLDRGTALAANLGFSYTWLCIGIALFAVPSFVTNGPAARGAVLVILYTVGLLMFVGDFAGSAVRAKMALARLTKLHGELSLERLPPPAAPLVRDEPIAIDMRGVTFAYPSLDADSKPFSVGPFDVSIRSSEIVFIAGGNGSGKTTFAKLLCGLYPPASGEIVWNGERVDEARLESFRNLFSAVFAEFHVFEDVLRHHERSVEERAAELLRKLCLEDKVDVRNGRLTTTDLSTGQKKRLALLVALLDDRPCYLFDEWAADQDPEFRAVFYQELLPELARRGKAVIAISHDERYFSIAHRVVKLAEGTMQAPPMSPAMLVARPAVRATT